jgi:hypothetical protein
MRAFKQVSFFICQIQTDVYGGNVYIYISVVRRLSFAHTFFLPPSLSLSLSLIHSLACLPSPSLSLSLSHFLSFSRSGSYFLTIYVYVYMMYEYFSVAACARIFIYYVCIYIGVCVYIGICRSVAESHVLLRCTYSE